MTCSAGVMVTEGGGEMLVAPVKEKRPKKKAVAEPSSKEDAAESETVVVTQFLTPPQATPLPPFDLPWESPVGKVSEMRLYKDASDLKAPDLPEAPFVIMESTAKGFAGRAVEAERRLVQDEWSQGPAPEEGSQAWGGRRKR